MTRAEMVTKLYNELCECKHWGEVREVFRECLEWNAEHYDEEIYMCEDDETDRVSIEDDYVEFDF